MYYHGNHLPHLHPPGYPLFITARLSGSLPAVVLGDLYHAAQEAERAAEVVDDVELAARLRLAARRHYLAALERHLDHGDEGARWLGQSAISKLVLDALHTQQQQGHYQLLAACVMSNHLHVVLVLAPEPQRSFFQVWADFKRFTGRKANTILGRTGDFWESESYDHVVRNGDTGLAQAIRYTACNPVKAGLVRSWAAWPGTWVAPAWHSALTL